MFLLIQGSNLGPKNKVPTIGTVTLNLAEYVYAAEGEEFELSMPLIVSGTAAEPYPSLRVSTNNMYSIAYTFCYRTIRTSLLKFPCRFGDSIY